MLETKDENKPCSTQKIDKTLTKHAMCMREFNGNLYNEWHSGYHNETINQGSVCVRENESACKDTDSCKDEYHMFIKPDHFQETNCIVDAELCPNTDLSQLGNIKENRMKDVFNRFKSGIASPSSSKTKDISSSFSSVDKLALKLASCKERLMPSSSGNSGTMPTNEEKIFSNDLLTGGTSVSQDDHNFLTIHNNSQVDDNDGLSRIIREIYERSLLRDKLSNGNINQTFTDSSAGNTMQTAISLNQSNNITETVGCVNKNERRILGCLDSDTPDYVFEIKTEKTESFCDGNEDYLESSTTSDSDTKNIDEKYEYFSRNVELFLNRDISKSKPLKTKNVSDEFKSTYPAQKEEFTPLNTACSNVETEVDAALSKYELDEYTKKGYAKHFDCEICNRKFSQIGHLNRHMRIHTGEKPFKCNICNKEFIQSGDKRRHERTHTSFRPYQCFICDKEFNQSGHLQRHLRVHAGHILYNNGEFDKELTRKKYMEAKEAAADKTKKCPLCEKTFFKKYLLERHIRSHTGETPYKCQECGKGFTRKDRLQTHARIHTGEKPYVCKECGKGFNQSNHLKTHIRIHTGDKPYKCGICGRGFAQSHDRTKHERVHTGERPYVCPLCGKDFNDNSQLWRHARTHDDMNQAEGTSFKCHMCDKEYELSSQLIQHMKIHIGEHTQHCQVPNLNIPESNPEMEQVRLTAEALVKETMNLASGTESTSIAIMQESSVSDTEYYQ